MSNMRTVVLMDAQFDLPGCIFIATGGWEGKEMDRTDYSFLSYIP